MPDVHCNKAELAHALGVSLPTLSRWMLRYGPDFPVVERGSNGRNYVFDFNAVARFLAGKREEEQQSKAEKDQDLLQLKLSFDVPGVEVPAPKASAKDELDAWKLRKFQREEAEACAALVPAEPTKAMIRAGLARLSRDTHAFLRQIAREQGWPDAYMRNVLGRFSDVQRVAVSELKQQAAEPSDAYEPDRAFA